ncbi:MAG: hypothetical protein P4M11_01015, partial [Candidatus Pacebacteria bacterium]|nr:hypothetical protein [Candidatus Paceibacterota bacterium]
LCYRACCPEWLRGIVFKSALFIVENKRSGIMMEGREFEDPNFDAKKYVVGYIHDKDMEQLVKKDNQLFSGTISFCVITG